MQTSAKFYKFMIAGLVLAIIAAAWLVISGLFSAAPEDSTPRTAVERLIIDAATAAKKSPNSVQARLNYVRALATGGNYGAALAQANRAEKLEPKNPELAMLRGSIYGRLGNTGEAIKWLRKAAKDKTQLADFYAQVYMDLAKAYEDEGKLDLALSSYDQVLKYTPISAPAYQNKGRIYELQGKKKDALDAYKTAYEFDAQDGTLAQAIDRLDRKLRKQPATEGAK